MKDRYHRITAWCACAALIAVFCTSTALAARVGEEGWGAPAGQAFFYTLPGEGRTTPGESSSTPDGSSDPTKPTSEPESSSSSKASSTENSSQTPPPASSSSQASSTPASSQKPAGPTGPAASSRNTSRPKNSSTSTVSSKVTSSEESSSEESSSEESSSSTISLPDVESMDLSIPQIIGSGVEEPTDNNSLMGIVAWVLIGVGILIVLIVLFTSAKSGSHKSVGRKRYHRGRYKSNKKHLLDDKYYHKKKYK